jgi:undecaprenyl-phosphate galactose phosphotransferase/putative colanic acid biosynthesis UDP-glucose lipid carrier transferase
MSNFLVSESWTQARKPRSVFQYISYQRIGIFTALSDLALIFAASFVAGIGYHYFIFQTEGSIAEFIAIGIYSGFIFVLIAKLLRLYQPNSLLSASVQIRGVILAWSAVLLFVTSVFFLLKTGANYSRGAMIGFGLIGPGLIIASRAIIGANLRRALENGTLAAQRVIVVGDPEELAAKSASYMLRTYGSREVRRFELSPTTSPSDSDIAHDTEIVDSAIKAAQADRVERVLLALRWVDTLRRDLICERLRILPLPVLLLPDRFVSSIFAQSNSPFRSLAAIEVQPAPVSRQDLIVKRIFDVILAALALLFLSPLLLVISLAIKLDFSGPVLFRQHRRGFNGREFTIFKFRTMTVSEDGPAIRQAQRNDDRVTRVGRLLRMTSIDELPQLFNVLAGKMSLVGPRPHAVAHDDEYSNSVDNYVFRHHVKPGITGWAQVHGFRGETSDIALMKKRIELDLWYVNNWSLWLDLRIVMRTCLELLRPQNVY